jgi:hypothetical protein
MTTESTVLVTQSVTWRRICDLICTGIEGGFSSWLHHINREGEWSGEEPAYYQPEFWLGGGRYSAKFDRESDNEGDGKGRATFDSAALVNGLRLMAEKEPRHFADFMQENDDAVTGDVFLQCVLLKAVIYG